MFLPVVLLTLALCTSVAEPQEPKKATDAPLPPWQRLLSGSDAQQALELTKHIGEATARDDYVTAAKHCEDLLRLRKARQGPSHWEVVDQEWTLQTLRTISNLPVAGRKTWRESEQRAAQAASLSQAGKHEEALKLHKAHEKLCLNILGKAHPELARTYFAIGIGLRNVSKEAEAIPFLEKALEIDIKQLGEVHPQTASTFLALGEAFMSRSRPADAQVQFEKALRIHLQVLGEGHAETAGSFNRLGFSLRNLGKHAEAEANFRKGLEICQKALGDDNPHTVGCYNNVALSLREQGNKGASQELLLKALKICQKSFGEENTVTADTCNYLAANLNDVGKHAAAQPFHEVALTIYVKHYREEHLSSAGAHSVLALNLDAQRKYKQAEPHHRQAVATRTRLLGVQHPESADSVVRLALNLYSQKKFEEARPLLEKGLATRLESNGDPLGLAQLWLNVASVMNDAGHHTPAQTYHEKALAVHVERLGEEHSTTINTRLRLAATLSTEAKFAEAELHYRKALAILRLKHGDHHPSTLGTTSNLASSLDKQGRYAEAESLHRQVLEHDLRFRGEQDPATDVSFSNLAHCLSSQGKYAEAEPLYRKSLSMNLKTLSPSHADLAKSYSNLALTMSNQGRHEEAQPLMEKALELSRKHLNKDDLDTVLYCNNLASILSAQKKYPETEKLNREVLARYKSRLGDDHNATGDAHNNLAHTLLSTGRLDEALTNFEQAVAIWSRLHDADHPKVTLGLQNVAVTLSRLGKASEAQRLHERVLDSQRRRLGEGHPYTASSYEAVAIGLIAQGRTSDADGLLEKAVASQETNRIYSSTGLGRALSVRSNPRLLLAALRAESKPVAAWNELELSLSRGLLDHKAAESRSTLSEMEQADRSRHLGQVRAIQAETAALLIKPKRTPAEDAQLDTLLMSRRQSEEQLARLAVIESQREVASLDAIRQALADDAAMLLWMDVAHETEHIQEHWACVVRRTGAPKWVRLTGSGEKGIWLKEDLARPAKLRGELSKDGLSREVGNLVPKLRAQRIAPVLKHLDGVHTLYVVGVNEMAGIPIELVAPEFIIGYVPSGTFLARLPKKAERPATLLAVGDPIYEVEKPRVPTDLPSSGLLIQQIAADSAASRARLQPEDVLLQYGDAVLETVEDLGAAIQKHAKAKEVTLRVWRIDSATSKAKELEVKVAPGPLGVVLAAVPAPEAIASRRKSDVMMLALRGNNFKDLRGTRAEVSKIAAMFGRDSKVFFDSDASEQSLEALRRQEKLKNFRYLHFATHGVGNSVRAFESALILTQDRPRQDIPKSDAPLMDNQLTAREVLEFWKLDADLVTLSACETAIGRQGGGDGLLGFAQAFLLAGSRSVCLSLWKVDDTATALLMQRFYQNLLGKRAGHQPMKKSVALKEAKEWLRNLTTEEILNEGTNLVDGVARSRGPIKIDQFEPLPAGKPGAKNKPYDHPKYWAAFILIGDPD